MEQTITQICFTDKYQVELRTETLHVPEGALLVKNQYSLISPGTELALYTGMHIGFSDPDIAWARYPICSGYASVGRVEYDKSEGANMQGKTVLHFSPHSSYSAIQPQEELFFVLDDSIDKKAALFARFAQIAATAVNICHVDPKAVLIFGAGLIGNLCAQLYQHKHDRVFLADISEKRLEIARQCGVKQPIDSGLTDFPERLQVLSDDHGIDLIIEGTGAPELVGHALELVNEFGEVLLLGSTRGTVELNVYKCIHRKKAMLTGAHEGYFPLRSETGLSHEHFVNHFLELLGENRISVKPMISHEISPFEVKQAYEGLLHEKDTHLGVIINWMKEE